LLKRDERTGRPKNYAPMSINSGEE
jgi:hypothetical protein